MKPRVVATGRGITLEFPRPGGRFEPLLDGATGKPALLRGPIEIRRAIDAPHARRAKGSVCPTMSPS